MGGWLAATWSAWSFDGRHNESAAHVLLQVATRATWGKRNIDWAEGDTVSVRVTNTRTGRVAEVKPTRKLTELLTSIQSPQKAAAADDTEHEPLEGIARQIARWAESEMLVVELQD
jgi:hypothetical protein